MLTQESTQHRRERLHSSQTTRERALQVTDREQVTLFGRSALGVSGAISCKHTNKKLGFAVNS